MLHEATDSRPTHVRSIKSPGHDKNIKPTDLRTLTDVAGRNCWPTAVRARPETSRRRRRGPSAASNRSRIPRSATQSYATCSSTTRSSDPILFREKFRAAIRATRASYADGVFGGVPKGDTRSAARLRMIAPDQRLHPSGRTAVRWHPRGLILA